MNYLTLNENPTKNNQDSNTMSRIIATEQRPLDSEAERSRASPAQTLEVESSLRSASKKHSHPGCMSPLSPSGSMSAPVTSHPASRLYSFSPPGVNEETVFRSPGRAKKHSLPANSRPVPTLSLNNGDNSSHDDDVTRQLESAVRKMSRGSPSLQGSSPNRMSRTSPSRFSSSPYLTDLNLSNCRMGLSGLARGYEQYRESLMSLRPATEFGEASSDDLSSEWESSSESDSSPIGLTFSGFPPNGGPRRQSRSDVNDGPHFPIPVGFLDRNQVSEKEETARTAPKRPSGWRKLRSMVQWTPFVQTFKNRRYQWVQLAGHSGNFKAGKNQGTVLKKCCPQEENCYKQFHNDSLHDYVPDYQGTLVLDDDEKFIQLQDCLSSFNLPSIMDCKIGVRTYLEEELAKAKEKPKLRKDMYEKMIAVDPSAPTEEEHRLKGITKPRYMVWRETISSTATLGFRIEGVKKNDGTSSKEFKTTKTKEQILESFRNFISGSVETAKQYLERLVIIRHALDKSEFFKSHELIGSSLLFVHDSTKACIWLIDFGKTVPVPEGTTIDHKSPWEVGNHEDGYLIGVENLIAIFSELVIVLEREGNGIDNSDCTTVPTTTTNLNIGKNKMLTSQPPSLS